MDRRLALQKIFERILGCRNVYFQPPESFKMQYPCIVYELKGYAPFHANNKKHRMVPRYQVMLITADPDNDILDKILELPMTSLETPYTASNLYHYPITLYY